MEYDLNASRLDGALKTLSKKGKLKSEDCLEEVTDELKNVFSLTDDKNSVRRMVYLFLLHTNLPVVETLKDYDLDVYIPDNPTCDFGIFLIVLHQLKLETYLNEIILYSPVQLSSPILVDLVKKLKESSFYKDNYNYTCLETVLETLFHKFVNAIVGNMSVSTLDQHFLSSFEQLVELLEQTLFVMLDMLDDTTDDKIVEFCGLKFYSFFSMLMNCMDVYYNKLPKYEVDLNQFYNSDVDFQVQNYCLDLDTVKNCLLQLINLSEKTLMRFSFNIWLNWSEVNHNGLSLQQKIGELFYQMLKLIHNNNSDGFYSKEMIECLKHLSIKPITDEELMKNSSIEEIIEHLKSNKKCTKWLQELLSRENLLSDEKCLLFLQNDYDLHGVENLEKLFQTCLKYFDSNQTSNIEVVKTLLLKVFEKLPLTLKCTCFKLYFEKYYSKFSLELPDAENVITLTFNKLVGDKRIDVPTLQNSLMYLCIQLPSYVLEKIILQSLTDLETMKFMSQCLVILKDACFYVENNVTLITKIIDKLFFSNLCSHKDREKFVTLIFCLAYDKVINLNSFVESVVSRNICSHIKQDEINFLYFDLDIVKKVLDGHQHILDLSVWLIMMFDVMRYCCWNPNVFSETKATVKAKAVILTYKMMKCFVKLHPVEDETVKVIRQNMNEGSIVSKSNFCQLWCHYNQTFPQSTELHELLLLSTKLEDVYVKLIVEFLQHQEKTYVRGQLVLSVIKLLPVLTSFEANLLALRLRVVVHKLNICDSPDYYIIDILTTALFFISHCLNNKSVNFTCFKYVVCNVCNLFEMFWTDNITMEQNITILKSFVLFVQIVRDHEHRETTALTVSNVLLNIVTKLKCCEDKEKFVYHEVHGVISLLNVVKVEEFLYNILESDGES